MGERVGELCPCYIWGRGIESKTTGPEEKQVRDLPIIAGGDTMFTATDSTMG